MRNKAPNRGSEIKSVSGKRKTKVPFKYVGVTSRGGKNRKPVLTCC